MSWPGRQSSQAGLHRLPSSAWACPAWSQLDQLVAGTLAGIPRMAQHAHALQHTAPHIPFRPEGVSGQDLCTAIVSGTVTIRLPSWLEAVLNYPNYHMPQHLAPDDVPYYNAKRATEGLRERLWPYMTEGKLSVKLLVNHITKWQVYDTEQETYITFDEAMQKVTSLEQQQEGAAPAASS
eukprot:CAMPEP_0202364582 /NCGR_PEP_ID=MMETSP1126-20121109/15938_1 /ASSEMBLY_ACC=CAM_ASM_000457 /TAXON_ID=3047 /ORGANISM="Dunaliella tertiolecta, Strain CCMP1320" /LENGTH=179 /DNA_ID=CAMNT_0048959265 /DNA_START=61 /DNA_END=601 /DNA_ORIENTATION=-